jgi:pilus assembly protein CpaF
LSITEVTGLSDTIIATQELYRYEPLVNADGEEIDNWTSLGIHPHSPKLARFKSLLGSGFGNGFSQGGFRD